MDMAVDEGSSMGLGMSTASNTAPSTSSSTPIDSSNIGFQMLKKHGWKEGTGLGVSEQESKSNTCLVMDYTHVFTTNQFFESRDHLISWARNVGDEHGMVIVVKRSDNGGGKKKPRLFLACERSGPYRKSKRRSLRGLVENVEAEEGVEDVEVEVEFENDEKLKKRKNRTKKCDCPFLLRGKQISVDSWALEVDCGVHNHPTAQHLIDHSYAGRLSQAEEEFVIDMSKSNSRPKDILFMLQKKFPNNKSTMKTIYNARVKHRVFEKGGKSQLEYLLSKVKEHRYFYHHRQCEKTDTVKDIFFAHPTSVELLRAFPRVLLMDCTYKTNKNKLPLLEIVGMTSTGMTFQAACAYMESEREDNYIWACTILKSLMDQSCLPSVIVTDRDVTLMNALETCFPSSRYLLCRWHIARNILTNCKHMFRSKEKWDSFNASWNLLVYADSESTFYELLRRFQADYAEYSHAIEYAMNQWIQPYKERFVSAWTNSIMHFNNTATNRAESHHSILKKQLESSMGNFETCWAKIHTLLETSHKAIKASFEASINVVQPRYKSNIFKSLRGLVSIDALSKIYDEIRGIPDGGIALVLCGCVLKKTCGLPCAHELVEFVRDDKPIRLDMVDSFWRKLNMDPIGGVESDIGSRWSEAMDNLNSIFTQANESERLLMLRRLKEVSTFEDGRSV